MRNLILPEIESLDTDLLITAGLNYQWARLIRVDNETYSIPLYVCRVLEGEHAGETIATSRYFDQRGHRFDNPLNYQYQF